jgi:hypothetical protein
MCRFSVKLFIWESYWYQREDGEGLMSDEIYRVVKEYLLSRNDGWRFVLGEKIYDKHSLIEKMEKDKKFRKFIIDEVIKTAVDLLTPKQ